MLRPTLPDYDIGEWERSPFSDRVRRVCQAWAVQGYGTPPAVYLAYLLKIGVFVAGWWFFATRSSGVEGSITRWWFTDDAFKKAILWSVAFEGLGLGSGSGPLTGRYFPPIGGALYVLRPGTTKLPLVPGLPVLGRPTRTWVDVMLYLVHYGFLARALMAPEVVPALVIPPLILLPLLGVADKTAFLAARPDHYLAVLVAFVFPVWLPAAKLVWWAIWFWAATSKLNRHFPGVVAVMVSNSPWAKPFRRWMYRRHPDDLRPSTLARAMAHGGTVVEYLFPILLVFGSGGVVTRIGLFTMVAFHLFITTSIPMGVPLEWNVVMVYGGFVLFGHHAQVRAWDVHPPLLVGYLVVALVVVPLVGNLWPRRVSFLMSMRYYAGNWAYSVWLFRGDAADRLDEDLVKSSPGLRRQLGVLYDGATTTALLSKVIAFRCMHLHGRALRDLVPRAVDDVDAYEWIDGELVAGMIVGWNFGEGHLHGRQLVEAVQAQCGFAPGEVRVVIVESQPLFRPRLDWVVVDASAGVVERGSIDVRDLVSIQPWPDPS